MKNITYFLGTFSKITRTKNNDLYVFATNSKTTWGDVGYRKYLELDSDKQDTVANFTALIFGANACYIYSLESMSEKLAELVEEGEEFSLPELLIKVPYNFGL